MMKRFYSYLAKGEDDGNALRWPNSILSGNTNKMPCLTSGPGSRCMEIACGPSQALNSETRKSFSTQIRLLGEDAG